MKVSVVIPVCQELEFLLYNVECMKKFRHPEIDYEIIIANQMEWLMSDQAKSILYEDPEIIFMDIPRIDAGYPIDRALKIATGEYFCSFDADAFPIHNNWLHLPVQLVKKYNLSFVGKETGLHNAYHMMGRFCHINNYYRVSRTDLAQRISNEVGFLRFDNWNKAGFNPSVPISWDMPCDNGVVAQWHSDQQRMGGKISLAMNKVLGFTNAVGVYGMIIDDLVFHMVFGYATEYMGDDQYKTDLGDGYHDWMKLIKEQGLDTIAPLMVKQAKQHHPIETDRQYWDMDRPWTLHPSTEMYQFIESLK